MGAQLQIDSKEAYGLAVEQTRESLLCKGNNFSQTDIVSALA